MISAFRAPKFMLTRPQDLYTGDEVACSLLMSTKRAVRIERIEASLQVTQGFTRVQYAQWTPLGVRNRAETRSLHRGDVMVSGASTVRGEQHYPLTITLPPSLPPACELGPAFVRYVLAVSLSRPRWFTTRAEFPLPVRSRPEDCPAEAARLRCGANGVVEVTLDSCRVSVGGSLSGKIRPLKHPSVRYSEVELTLQQSVMLLHSARHATRGVERTIKVPLGRFEDGIPFMFNLDPEIAPTFSTTLFSTAWHLVVTPLREGKGFWARSQDEQDRGVIRVWIIGR